MITPLARTRSPYRDLSPPLAPTYIGESPRRLVDDPAAVDHPLAQGRYQSPLRYPGAKSRLAPTIGRLIEAAKRSRQVRQVDLLVEPFAGGSSVSLRLVGGGIVNRVLLADADPLVAAFWQVAASRPEYLIDRMRDEYRRFVQRGGRAAVERWDYWRHWHPSAGMSTTAARDDAAVKCLFLNRTTFSGILHGSAGPIGGRAQISENSFGCRWNPEGLEERIGLVGHLYDTGRLADVWCMDWQETLDTIPERYPHLIPSRVVAYLDPPYIEKSPKLYSRSFDPNETYPRAPVADLSWWDHQAHFRLAGYLRRKAQFRWVLSYDAHPSVIRHPHLYSEDRMTPEPPDRKLLHIRRWHITKRVVTLNYTASARLRGTAEELLLTTLPPATVPMDHELRPVPSSWAPPNS